MNFLEALKQKAKSKNMRNAFWIIGERIISVGATTVVTIFSARVLGASDFGTLNYGLTLTTLFLAVMKLGIDSIIVNELIKHRHREGEFLGTSILLRLVASLLSILLIALTLAVLNSGQDIVIIVALVQSVILPFQAMHVLDYWFQSHLRSKYVSIAKTTATLLSSAYSAYLLLSGKGVIWFAASTVLTGALIAALLWIFYKKQGGSSFTFTISAAKYLLGKSHHFIAANIMSLTYVQIDKVMIGNMTNSAQLGLYSAALMISTAWLFLPDSLITSFRPTILSSRLISRTLFLSKLKQLYFTVFWLCTVVCLLITIFAPLIVPFLFGEDYSDSIVVLQVAVWFVPFSILGTARGIWIVGEEKGAYVKYYLFCGVLMNISLNLILIPAAGILGAAIASVITEFFTCFIAPMFFKETRVHSKIVTQAIFHRI